MVGEAESLIKKYCLSPLHGEGGYFRFLSTFGANSGCIYYLITSSSHSKAHILDNDEAWFFLEGGRAMQIICDPDTGTHEQKILDEEHRFSLVRKGMVQTTFLLSGSYALFSTVMSPRYRDEDYHEVADDIIKRFPILKEHV